MLCLRRQELRIQCVGIMFMKCRKVTQYLVASGSQGPGKVVQSIVVSIKALMITQIDAPVLTYSYADIEDLQCPGRSEQTKNCRLWRIDRCSQVVLGVLVAPPNLALG